MFNAINAARCRSLGALLLATVLWSQVGCGTSHRLRQHHHGFDASQVFGGVQQHVKEFPCGHTGRTNMEEAYICAWTWPWIIVDIPLSAAADTLLLPVTIPIDLSRPVAPLREEENDDDGAHPVSDQEADVDVPPCGCGRARLDASGKRRRAREQFATTPP